MFRHKIGSWRNHGNITRESCDRFHKYLSFEKTHPRDIENPCKLFVTWRIIAHFGAKSLDAEIIAHFGATILDAEIIAHFGAKSLDAEIIAHFGAKSLDAEIIAHFGRNVDTKLVNYYAFNS